MRKVGSVTLYLHYSCSSVIATLFSQLTSGTPFINVIWFGCLLRNSCLPHLYVQQQFVYALSCLCLEIFFLSPCCFKITFWCKIDSIIFVDFFKSIHQYYSQNENANSWRLIWKCCCFKMITLHYINSWIFQKFISLGYGFSLT